MKSLYKIKNTFISGLILLCSHLVIAQANEGMTYQTVIRNASNALVANAAVGIKISLLQSTATGTIMYSESHTPTTNVNGLATIVIGNGLLLSGNYGTIDWANNVVFLKTEIDPSGGTSYTISDTSQLLSVPFAKYANEAGNSWRPDGNAVGSTEFIGTVNDADVNFKRNNLKAGKIGLTNTYLGVGAGEFNIMGGNVAIGTNALNKGGGGGSVGNLNTAVGYDSYPNNIDGYGNAAFGNNSLFKNTNGILNAAIGAAALQQLTTGDRNTAIGQNSLSNLTTGNENIGVGNNSNVPSATASKQLSIGNVIYGTNMGDTATGTIGIGVAVPTEKLEVAGKTKTTNLQVTASAGMNKILTSDALGNATWQNSNANTGIHITQNANQVIPTTTSTKINFTNELTDDTNAFNLSTDEWTIPSSGFYHIEATARFNVNFAPNTRVDMIISINGGTISKAKVFYISQTNSVDVSADLKLVANDVVTINIYQESGVNATLSSNPNVTFFTGYKIY